jgi:hypothetical protein
MTPIVGLTSESSKNGNYKFEIGILLSIACREGIL